MNVISVEGGVPIKAWTDGVPVEEQAEAQLRNCARMPFIHRWIAAMPDVHWGMGATVGSVIATDRAIIPAAVGVDIGCGMTAVRTELTASDLPDSLHALRSAIESAVPHGRTNDGQKGDRGAWGEVPESFAPVLQSLEGGLQAIAIKHPKIQSRGATWEQIGTLGSGNHFIEVCLDQEDRVWAMLHSGSRGVGNRIGQYFITKAKEEMERYFISLPDKDLAYLAEATPVFGDYVQALNWAQQFAKTNRLLMRVAVLSAMEETFGRPIATEDDVIDCHHNYVQKERHWGKDVWLTRKGAVSAREGQLGIIPGSMGARSFIVAGKGNPESFHSCSHGAGRAMSRGEAKRRFTVADLNAQMGTIESRRDADVIDEIPSAYKDIEAVMAAQADLVDVKYELRQILCVKG